MDERFINSSTWMRDTLHLIGHKSLTDLILPGTHDSAAYKFTDKYMPGSQSKKVQRIINITDFLIKNVIKNIEITQELTIYKQLKRGARYLDIRAGWLDHKWYTYHCHAGPTVEKVLKDVQKFLIRHECEVVIIEISHFRNSNKENERILRALVVQYLGDMLCDVEPMGKFPLFDIISRNKRAVVVMPKIYEIEQCIWSDRVLKNSYPNKNKIKEIKKYNENRIKDNPKNKFLKISWILTPNASNLKEKLLKLAKGVNHEMLKSFSMLNARLKSKKLGGNEEVLNERKVDMSSEVAEESKEELGGNEETYTEKKIDVSSEGVEEQKDKEIEESKEELSKSEASNEDYPVFSDESEQEEEEEKEIGDQEKINQSVINIGVPVEERNGLEGIIILIDHFGKSNIMRVIYELNNLIHS